MPLVHPTPDAPPALKPNIPEIAKPQYRGVTVDTEYVPQSALLTNIEGSAWTVNWYSQVVNDDNDLSGQQMTRDPTQQQYRLINRMELKVQTPLVNTQDQTTKQMHTTGTAVVYPFLIPLEGDMFLADIGDGREGVFRVTNTERRTFYRESCFQIDYLLVDYSTEQRRGDLTRKVVQELYFRRDFLIHGQNPLLIKSDEAAVITLSERYFNMLHVYLNMFSSTEFKTIIIPGQERPCYDPFLLKAVSAFFNSDDDPLMLQNRILNVDDKLALQCFTIWDAIMRRDPDLLNFINKKTRLLSTLAFTEQPMLEGIRYTGIEYVVYPCDEQIAINYEIIPCDCEDYWDWRQLCAVPSRPGLLKNLLGQKVLAGLPYGEAPLIHEVLADDYYIFSKMFYHNEPGQSKLELMVRDYLNGKAINRHLLVLFSDTYQAWGGMERLYFLPIILMLIRASIRSI